MCVAAALDQSEAACQAPHWEALLDALPGAAAILDGSGRARWVNAAWNASLSDSRPGAPLMLKVAAGDDFLAACEHGGAVGAGDAWRLAAGVRAVLGGMRQRFRIDATCPAGGAQGRFAVTVSSLPLGDSTGALVMHLDAPEPTAADVSKANTEAHYRAVFEGSSLPMMVYEPASLRILAVNDAAVQQTGYAREEFLAMTAADLIPPDDLESLKLDVTKVLAGSTGRRHWQLRHKCGDLRQFEAHAHTLPWAGTLARLVVGLDVSARAAAQAHLRESERRFRYLTDNISEVFWISQRPGFAGEGMYVSPAYEAIWGRSIESLANNPQQWFESIHPEDRAMVAQAMQEQAEREHEIEYRILRPDGSVRWIADRGFPVDDADGAVRRVAGVARDITRRRQMEQHLAASQRLEALGSLTGGVAHDFNNLLTVMHGNAELLCEQLPGSGLNRHLAKMIVEAAQRGAQLTQRLLAFARKQALQPRSVDVNRLVRSLDGMLRRTLGDDIEVRWRPADSLWPTLVDPAQLENALLNLAINARDAMPTGGRLSIQTANARLDAGFAALHPEVTPGDYVAISVSDSGRGIPREHLARVFEPFFTTKRPGKGTGLGLAMVYGFVRQSHGHVVLDSEVGKGTTVRIYLPRDLVPAAQDKRPADAPTPPGAGQLILLVEDDAAVREYARDQLSALGYRVLEAANGPEALDWLGRRPDIELLFTDVVMPGGLNGGELARAAVALRPELRVLFTSGYAGDALSESGRLAADVLLLGKPYGRAELGARVHEALHRPGGGPGA